MRRPFLLLCLLLSLGAAGPSTKPASGVDQLIARLGDRDPSVRERATRELTSMGSSARAALLSAAKSDDPEVSARAGSILRNLPWFVAGDPLRVREILRAHAKRNPEDRMTTVTELMQLPGRQGLPGVLRLLENETDMQFRWSIVSTLRAYFGMAPGGGENDEEDAPAAEGNANKVDTDGLFYRNACRKLPTERDDPPVLCLAAAAWSEGDPDRSLKLYQRAIAAADLQSTMDGGELEYAFDFAYGQFFIKRQYNEAAKLLRRKSDRSDQRRVAGVPEPVALLFMMHAKYGPIDGLASDRLRYSRYQLHSPVLYADSVALTRKHHWIAAELVDRLALYAGGDFPPATRLDIARFLSNLGIGRSAVRELEIFLNRQGPQDTLEEKLAVVNAHMTLAKTQVRIANYGAAGRSLEQALSLLESLPDITITYNDGHGPPKRGEEALKHHHADMNGYFLQEALERNDQAEVAKRIAALMKGPMENSEVAQEMVFHLQNNGARESADMIFDPIEKRLAEAAKKDPTPNNKNSLAWFRARCGRKLEEALKLAQEASAGEPTNAAYIDTLAEVHFQMGKADEAVKIERRALAADPGAPELESQMRRFLRGRSKQ